MLNYKFDPNNSTYSQLTDEEMQEFFLIMLDNYNGNIARTCKATKLPRSLYDKWMQIEEFRDCVLMIKEQTIDLVEGTLVDVALLGDVKAIKLYLESQARHRGYHKDSKRQIEISGPDGGAIPVGHYPPQPQTLSEWQTQVNDARQSAQDSDKQPKAGPADTCKHHANGQQLALPAPGQTAQNTDT